MRRVAGSISSGCEGRQGGATWVGRVVCAEGVCRRELLGLLAPGRAAGLLGAGFWGPGP